MKKIYCRKIDFESVNSYVVDCEDFDILKWIDDIPKNERVWEKWNDVINSV